MSYFVLSQADPTTEKEGQEYFVLCVTKELLSLKQMYIRAKNEENEPVGFEFEIYVYVGTETMAVLRGARAIISDIPFYWTAPTYTDVVFSAQDETDQDVEDASPESVVAIATEFGLAFVYEIENREKLTATLPWFEIENAINDEDQNDPTKGLDETEQ